MTEKLSDEATANFLHAAIVSLRQDIVPHLANPSARINADQLTRVLYMLHGRFSSRGADLRQLLAADRSLAMEIDALLPNQAAITAMSPATQDSFSAVDALEQEVWDEELRLAGKFPALLELAQGNTPKKQQALACLRKVVKSQQDFLSAQDPDILKGSRVCYQGGRIDEERPVERPALYGAEMTEANLTRHLQKQFPGCRVEKLSVMAGGFSKTTVFFTLVDASGKSEPLVMRKDIPVEFNSSVAGEFPLLQRLHKAGFTVAEPLWLEADDKPFGGRFMVSRRVDGSTDISKWAGDKQAVDKFARQLAKVMVDLHSIKLEQLGYGTDVAGKSAGDMARVEIDRWYDIFVRTRPEVFPMEEMAMAWVKANIPATLFSRPASPVHGDIGFHNLMIDEGKVTALLDWEFFHPGDPVEDLLYTKSFIEQVMDWETFKSYYREYGGATCTPEEEFFYVVWAKTRIQASSIRAAEVFGKSMPDMLKFAAAGFVLGRYLELEAGQMIVDSLGV